MAMNRIAFVASETEAAQCALSALTAKYGQCSASEAEVVVALGGDGFMLQTLHDQLSLPRPVYGMNRGTVGFLMNAYDEDNLPARLATTQATRITPLKMRVRGVDGRIEQALAFNEVSLLRETRQAAKLRISVDGKERLTELVCDGVLAATPAGSTAYNLSAHGPILPIGAELIALTPISAFRPRRWRGALLPSSAQIRIEVLEAVKRPVSAVADFHETRDIRHVDVAAAPDMSATLLFDPDHSLDERLIKEQFLV
ncbi:MAG: NAD kinase [Neomegalonema sp.]|nr:NAD kinase [Neomegalonema sp.]